MTRLSSMCGAVINVKGLVRRTLLAAGTAAAFGAATSGFAQEAQPPSPTLPDQVQDWMRAGPAAIRSQNQDIFYAGPYIRIYRDSTVQDCLGLEHLEHLVPERVRRFLPPGVCIERPLFGPESWDPRTWSPIAVRDQFFPPASPVQWTATESLNLRTLNPEVCVGGRAVLPPFGVGYGRQQCYEYDVQESTELREFLARQRERQADAPPAPPARPAQSVADQFAQQDYLAREYGWILQNAYNVPVEELTLYYRQQGVPAATLDRIRRQVQTPTSQRVWRDYRPVTTGGAANAAAGPAVGAAPATGTPGDRPRLVVDENAQRRGAATDPTSRPANAPPMTVTPNRGMTAAPTVAPTVPAVPQRQPGTQGQTAALTLGN
jgi:hypothetical protein